MLARQCVSDRIATLSAVQEQVAAWQHSHNQAHADIDWRFTAADAHIKLKRLYHPPNEGGQSTTYSPSLCKSIDVLWTPALSTNTDRDVTPPVNVSMLNVVMFL